MRQKQLYKRLFDIIFSFLGLLVLSPVFLLLVILIRLESAGDAFYISDRVGRNERLFKFIKFRTMYPNSNSIAITIGEYDPRITRIGRYLRKYKLDELPQLFNVIIGDISFVGPRADVPKYSKYYKRYFMDYYDYKPGITCYSSIYFSNESELYVNQDDPEKIYFEETIPKKVQLDMKYFNQNSIYVDIKIILLTLLKIFSK